MYQIHYADVRLVIILVVFPLALLKEMVIVAFKNIQSCLVPTVCTHFQVSTMYLLSNLRQIGQKMYPQQNHPRLAQNAARTTSRQHFFNQHFTKPQLDLSEPTTTLRWVWIGQVQVLPDSQGKSWIMHHFEKITVF